MTHFYISTVIQEDDAGDVVEHLMMENIRDAVAREGCNPTSFPVDKATPYTKVADPCLYPTIDGLVVRRAERKTSDGVRVTYDCFTDGDA